MAKVEVSVQSRLSKIVEDLSKIKKEAESVGKALEKASKQIGEEQQKQTKKTETFLEKLKKLQRETAKEMADDFKALLSLEGVGAGMALSNQFKKNVKSTTELGDTVRRLGNIFGITKDKFGLFQSTLVKGMGKIGLSSDSARRSLEGLSKTQVRGVENLQAYAELSGMLAETAGESEGEANIAQGIAGVLTARGQDPNDIKSAKALGEDLRRAFNATGASATEILASMEQMYQGMDKDFRKALSTRSMVSLAVIRQVAGPQSTAFLQEFLLKSPQFRKAWEARGFKDVFGPQGLNVDKFRQAAGSLMGKYKGDPRLMVQTLGVSEEVAEGFVRLYQSLDRVAKAQDNMNKSTGNLTAQYQESMGMAAAFEANLNRTKAILSRPLSEITQGITGALGTAAKSDVGAGAVTLGAGMLSALLVGGGLKGLLSMGKSGAKAAGYEAVTGENVVPVNVVNAAEIGSGVGTAITPWIARIAAAGAVGVGAYAATSSLLDPNNAFTQWANENVPGYKESNQLIESAVSSIVDALGTTWGYVQQGGQIAGQKLGAAATVHPNFSMPNNPPRQDVHVKVTIEPTPGYKVQTKTTRGSKP